MAIKAAINFSAILGAVVMPISPEPEHEYYEINALHVNDNTQRHQDVERVLDLSSLLQPVQSAI